MENITRKSAPVMGAAIENVVKSLFDATAINTRRTMSRSLALANEYLPMTRRQAVFTWGADEAAAFAAWLDKTGLSRGSIDTYMSCLSTIFEYVADTLGLALENPFLRARQTKRYKAKKRRERHRGRALDERSVRLMFRAVDVVFTGISAERARIALALGFLLGKRVATICSATWGGYDGSHLRTVEKGDREHTVVVPERVRSLLDAYRERYNPAPDHRIVPRATRTVREWVARLSEAAGVGHVAPHDMRRTFATLARNGGTDISVLSEWLGHRDISTSVRYLRESAVKDSRHVPAFIDNCLDTDERGDNIQDKEGSK